MWSCDVTHGRLVPILYYKRFDLSLVYLIMHLELCNIWWGVEGTPKGHVPQRDWFKCSQYATIEF